MFGGPIEWDLLFALPPVYVFYSWVVASVGGIRKKKRVILNSNLKKILLGFPPWIEEIDRSYAFLNIFNIVLEITAIICWFVFSIEQKNMFSSKLIRIVVFIMFAELLWSVIIACLAAKDNPDKFYIRETFDLKERKDEITFYSERNPYHCYYVYTHLKENPKPDKVVILFPEGYYTTQDVNGNVREYLEKGKSKPFGNIGPYEELSDRLVRAGYATLRCERTEENLINENERDGLDGIGFGKLFLEILKREACEGEIYLLLHGKVNQLLFDTMEVVPVSGILSLCGAGMDVREEYMQLQIWKGKSYRTAEKRYEKAVRQIRKKAGLKETDDSFLKPTREESCAMFVEKSKEIPMLIGYVEEDPYYSGKIAEVLKETATENMHVVKFEKTDFTLRIRNVNKRWSVYEWGRSLEKDGKLPPLNPAVAEELIGWLKEH